MREREQLGKKILKPADTAVPQATPLPYTPQNPTRNVHHFPMSWRRFLPIPKRSYEKGTQLEYPHFLFFFLL